MSLRKVYLIGALFLLALLIYLASHTFRSSLQYYLTVSELKASETNYLGRQIKMARHASKIEREDGVSGSIYHFIVTEGGREQGVTYKGIVPDTFKEGSDVVVTGRLTSEGRFEASELLAKCASKYEAKIQ